MFSLDPISIGALSYLAMLMIFRDFIQLLSITVRSLDFHISFPMKFSYASLTDWISFNFSFTVDISPQLVLTLQMIAMVFCTIYLSILTLKEVRAKFQGLQAVVFAEKSKFWQWMARGTIATITTISVPMVSTTFEYFAGTLEGFTKSNYMSFLSVLTILLCIIICPGLFFYGIKDTLPNPNRFSNDGNKHEDERSLYYKQLKSFHNPFKELYSQFCHKGAYFNLITMIFKFIRLAILVKPPNIDKNPGTFFVAFILDFAVNGLYHWYLVKVQPFHSYQENRCQILGSVNNIICIFLNMLILLIDEQNEKKSAAAVRLIISILQLISSLLVFQVYYLKTLLQYQPHCKRLFKMLFKELSFLPATSRSVFGIKGAKNRYSNYILFNQEVYNKYVEAKMRIWRPFWRKFISTEPDLKSPVKTDQLPFITIGEAPPFLKNFQGTVEERLEENQRIISLIGIEQYEIEIKKYENKEFQSLVQSIYDSIPPVDAIYKIPGQQSEGFCKCTIFPFPFTVQLAFDGSNKIQYLREKEELVELVKQNKSPSTSQLRAFRIQIRALRGQVINYTHVVNTTRTRTRTEHGRTEVSRVPTQIIYNDGILWVEPEVSSIAELSNGAVIDLGKGLKVELRYSSGNGRDDDGTLWNAGPFALKSADLQLELWGQDDTIIKNIVFRNKNIWVNRYSEVNKSIVQYVFDINNMFNKKLSILSYAFSSRLISCEYETFSSPQKIQALLNNEINPKMKSIMRDYKDQFDNLYKQLKQVEQNDFDFFLLCFFQEVWDLNQDLPMVKKNPDLLNYNQKDTCLMFSKRESINDWKTTLLERKLRTKRGGGYFNNKLFRNLQKVLNTLKDRPKNFVNLDDIKSHTSENKVAPKGADCEIQDLENNVEKGTRAKLEETQLTQTNDKNKTITRSLSKETTRAGYQIPQTMPKRNQNQATNRNKTGVNTKKKEISIK